MLNDHLNHFVLQKGFLVICSDLFRLLKLCFSAISLCLFSISQSDWTGLESTLHKINGNKEQKLIFSLNNAVLLFIKLSFRFEDYLTPLHVAAHCGNWKSAKHLIDSGCVVDSRALVRINHLDRNIYGSCIYQQSTML